MTAAPAADGRREFAFDLATALAVCVLCLLVFWTSMRLGSARMDVPLVYTGDALQYGYIIESAGRAGGLGHIDNAAAPFSTQNLDFPNGDTANLLLARMLGAEGEFGLRFNLFFLASVVLTALSGFAVARAIGLRRALAAAVAVAFTLLPFHFSRIGHLFYTNYSTMAVALWLCVRVAQPIWSAHAQSPWRRRWTLGLIALACAWCGATGVYYAFFTCLALGVTGVIHALDSRDWRAFARAAALGGAIAAVTAVQLVPTALMQREIGKNEQVARRGFEETEINGLKIVQMLLPTSGHRIDKFNELRSVYDSRAPLVAENSTASLGLLGAAGLCLALALALLPRLAAGLPRPVQLSSRLVLALVLFATIGGFGMVFALGITPQLRALNRISPFIGLLSLIVAAGVVQHLLTGPRARLAAIAIGLIAIVVAYLDQAPHRGRRDLPPFYAGTAAAFDSDRDFARELAQRLPKGANVLQLPYLDYPEVGAALGDYTQFRNNLHAPQLHWTHGAMKGRAESRWLQMLALSEPERFVAQATAVGFAAVVVDKRGMTALIERQIAAIAARSSPQIVQSRDGTQVAYVLQPRSAAVARAVAPDSGWYALEGGPERYWVWAKGDALLRLSDPLAGRDCSLALNLKTWAPRTVQAVSGYTVLATVDLVPGREATLQFKVPAQATSIWLRGGHAQRSPTADPRPVSFGWTLDSAPVCR